MSKEKITDIEEYEELDDIEEEVNEAHAEMDAKDKKKVLFKDRAKKFGKEALKYVGGALVGFGAAVVAGWAMAKSVESYDNDDDYDLLEDGESEETYDEE